MRKRTTHNDVMEDSDPEFNCERLPTPGLESDNWFYQLSKEVQREVHFCLSEVQEKLHTKGRHQTPLASDMPRKSKQSYTMQVLRFKENGIW